jgi:hypothetical protein
MDFNLWQRSVNLWNPKRNDAHTVVYFTQTQGMGVTVTGPAVGGVQGEDFTPNLALLDSGANVDIITANEARKRKMHIEPHTNTVQTSSGEISPVVGIVRNVTITLCKGNAARETSITTDLTVMDVKDDIYSLLLGTPFMKKVGITLDMGVGMVGYRKNWEHDKSWENACNIHCIPIRRTSPTAACSIIMPLPITPTVLSIVPVYSSPLSEQSTQTGDQHSNVMAANYSTVPPPAGLYSDGSDDQFDDDELLEAWAEQSATFFVGFNGV